MLTNFFRYSEHAYKNLERRTYNFDSFNDLLIYYLNLKALLKLFLDFFARLEFGSKIAARN